MDTEKFRALIEAVSQGSILAASQRLGYTPSGLNRMLNSLEAELGVTLLNRSRKGVSLTDAGDTLLPAIRRFLASGEQIAQLCGELNGLVRGRLRIGCYYSVAAHKLPLIVGNFNKQYPGVQVELVEDGVERLQSMLKDHSLDCGILGDPGDPALDFSPLMVDQVVVWLPKDHPLAGEPFFPVDALVEYPFIAKPKEKSDMLNRIVEKYGLTLDIRYRSQDSYTVYRMVEAGLGISTNNRLTNQQWRGKVAVLPLSPPQAVAIGLALPRDHPLSPAGRRFADFVAEHWEQDDE